MVIKYIPYDVLAELNERLHDATKWPHNDEPTFFLFDIEFTTNKLLSLRPNLPFKGSFLNDEQINCYMCLLQKYDNDKFSSNPSLLKSHYFGSFFMDRLLKTDNKYTFKNVLRWTKLFDIFEYKCIYIPINTDNNHWTLIVAFMIAKIIIYYDSLRWDDEPGTTYLDATFDWINDESKAKKDKTLEKKDWKFYNNPNYVPQQNNGKDCGVCVCACADYLSDDLPLSYNGREMTNFRLKIGTDIIRSSFRYKV